MAVLHRKYDAVIFDLFGTLIDYLPEEVYLEAHRQVADIFSVPLDVLRRVWADTITVRDTGVNGGVEQDIVYVSKQLGVPLTDTQLHSVTEIRLSLYRRNLAPRDGALTVIQTILSEGYRVGLISDCAAEIPRLWPESSFTSLITQPVFSVEVGVTKPDPRIYHTCCARLGIEPTHCLYIGDGSSYELTGARKVGMDALLLCVPHEREMVMRREDPRQWDGPVIEQVVEVLEYLVP